MHIIYIIQLYFLRHLQIVVHFLDLYRQNQRYSQFWIVQELLWIKTLGELNFFTYFINQMLH